MRVDGATVAAPRAKFLSWGGMGTQDVRGGVKAWQRRNGPPALQTKLEALAKDNDMELLFTPPYCLRFQPIELLWRGTENFVARECFLGRQPTQVANDIMDFWARCDASNKRGKSQPPIGPVHAAGYLAEVRLAINQWVAKHGVRLSGEVGDLVRDATAEYEDNGSMKTGDDAGLWGARGRHR